MFLFYFKVFLKVAEEADAEEEGTEYFYCCSAFTTNRLRCVVLRRNKIVCVTAFSPDKFSVDLTKTCGMRDSRENEAGMRD